MEYYNTKEEEFDKIYRTYQNDVYKISLYYTKDTYMAEDIMQKTFYKLYLHLGNVNLESVRSYLLRTARNLSYNWYRDTKREREGDCIENIPEETFRTKSAETEYIKNESANERKIFLDSIMERLHEQNESWYNILDLIYCHEKSHEEAAEELGITVQVLYSKLYRAKQWLKKNYESEYRRLTKGDDV